MQNILSINIDNYGVNALVLEADESSSSVLESKSYVDESQNLVSQILNLVKKDSSYQEDIDEDEENYERDNIKEQLLNAQQKLGTIVKSLLDSLTNSFTEIIVVIPAIENLTCKINLPFTDSKNIKQVLDMEVQDTLAFDVNDFVVPYKFIDQNPKEGNDFFVSMLPKKIVSFFLEAFRKISFEPYIVTTPASVLHAAYNQSNLNLDDNAIIGVILEDTIELSVIVAGKPVFCRSLDFAHLETSITKKQLLSYLKLTLNSEEKERGVTFEKVYLFQSCIPKEEVQHFLGRSVEELNIFSNDNIKQATPGNLYTKLAALSMNRSFDNSTLTNYRVREFAYNPYVSLLVKNLKQLQPFIYLLIILLFFYYVSVFLSREYKIIRIKKAVATSVAKATNISNLPKGGEISEIYNISVGLENQLESLGRRSKLSALDILYNVTADIEKVKKKYPEIEIKEIKISGRNFILSGNAKAYSEVERFESVLKKRSNMYCRIRRDTSSSSSNSRGRGFKFIIDLCGS